MEDLHSENLEENSEQKNPHEEELHERDNIEDTLPNKLDQLSEIFKSSEER